MASTSIMDLLKPHRWPSTATPELACLCSGINKSLLKMATSSTGRKNYGQSIPAENSINYLGEATRRKIASLKKLSISKNGPSKYKNFAIGSFSQRLNTIANQHRVSCKVSLTEPSQGINTRLQQRYGTITESQNTSTLKNIKSYCGYERLKNFTQRNLNSSRQTLSISNDKPLHSNSQVILYARESNRGKPPPKKSVSLHLKLRLRKPINRNRRQVPNPQPSSQSKDFSSFQKLRPNQESFKNEQILSFGRQRMRTDWKSRLPKMPPLNKCDQHNQNIKQKQSEIMNRSISPWKKSPQLDDSMY